MTKQCLKFCIYTIFCMNSLIDPDVCFCPLQLCFRLLSHPVLCGPAERRQAHLPDLQD